MGPELLGVEEYSVVERVEQAQSMSLVAVDFDNKVVDIVDSFAVLLEVAGIFVDCRRTLS